ncbi:MAG: 2-oxoacid:acceptor oxidoreductase subunit alpha [Oligoflexia bacterium]|nr:2-oxoacid:acceptor oxidoreductase subunit alpha [Oligoflexia bacterium]
MRNYEFTDRINIVLCGGAGQGIQTIEVLMTRILKNAGYNVFATKEYMSRVRGGSNSTTITVSSAEGRCFYNNIDLLIPLDQNAVKHLKKRITRETLILADSNIETRHNKILVDFNDIAVKLGNKVYANSVAAGYVLGLFRLDFKVLEEVVSNFFSGKSDEISEKNIKAVRKGYDEALKSDKISVDIARNTSTDNDLLINGSDAVALGAVAGGCNFMSSYPMSPSTGVFTNIAKYSKELPIIAEQAEDEISAINMAIGAWYAGSRAIVSTSGGGFALMTEGLSLAGMIESPLVIHLAQRPAPATGLPTRTEQGDLNFALYGGHGDFPRIILAPGNIEQAFKLSEKAFYYADKYQVPVIILTDQYLVDTYYNVREKDLLPSSENSHFFTETSPGYLRYRITDDGLSPRGIPGFGKGLVMVDSDEHDEAGRITEDLDLRIKMSGKRMKKLDLIKNDLIEPVFTGNKNYKNLIVAWGSNYHAVKNAFETLEPEGTAFLFFEQLYPLHELAGVYLNKAENIIGIENNFTGQFTNLLEHRFRVNIDKRILKYNGLAFSQEEIISRLTEVLI